MRPGQASQTAVLVCAARAVADGRVEVARFSDPTALALLPPEARERALRHRAGLAPTSAKERFARAFLVRQSQMMVARTIAIDDEVRAAAAGQVVILGAGLDGRAWRMAELADAVVFEVDHPASQADKRARAAALAPRARDVRFVAVDFTRDDLAAALAAAGHDASRPTTWVWEGVVMYLRPAEVEASVAIIARRSAPTSRLLVLYHRRALISALIGLMVRRLGEPLRSSYDPAAMGALLARHGFAVRRDRGLPELGAGLSREVARGTRPMRHLRLVTAERR